MEYYIFFLPKQLFIFLDSLIHWSIKHCILAQALQVLHTMYLLHS